MTLTEALALEKGAAVAFVGGGGKTTTMFRLAQELITAGRRVLITTTTQIYVPDQRICPTTLIADQNSPVDFSPPASLLTVGAGLLPQNKLAGLAPRVVDNLVCTGLADHVLVEADGSRGLSLKSPAPREPVVPNSMHTVVIVVGLDILGQRLNSAHVHRPELVANLSGYALGQEIDEKAVAKVLTHPRGFLSRIPQEARVVFLLNKADQVPLARITCLTTLLLQHGAQRVVTGAVIYEDPSLVVFEP